MLVEITYFILFFSHITDHIRVLYRPGVQHIWICVMGESDKRFNKMLAIRDIELIKLFKNSS